MGLIDLIEPYETSHLAQKKNPLSFVADLVNDWGFP